MQGKLEPFGTEFQNCNSSREISSASAQVPHRMAAQLPQLHREVPHPWEVLARDPAQQSPDLL